MNSKGKTIKYIKYFNYIVLVLLFLSAFIKSFHSDGPFKGKVVELETGKPIEGAVVAAEWTIEPFVHTERICDTTETVTDLNGDFELPKGSCISQPFAKMSGPYVVVFKPGYLGYPPLGANEHERISYMPDWGDPRLFENQSQFNLIKLGKPKTRQERLSTIRSVTLMGKNTSQLNKLIKKERTSLGFKE